MTLSKFNPTSPDLDIRQDSDMTPAKFGHLNRLVDDINAGCAGGGLSYFTTNSQVVCGRTSSGLFACGDSADIDVFISAKNNGRIQFGNNTNINTCGNFIDTVRNQTVLGGSIICSTYTGTNNTLAIGSQNTLICGNCNNVIGFRNTLCSTTNNRRWNLIVGSDNNLCQVGERNSAIGQANVITGGGAHSHVFGGQNTSSSTYSFTAGFLNTSSNVGVVAIGCNSNVSGACGIVIGSGNISSSNNSVSIGSLNCVTNCHSSILGGSLNTANAAYSSIFGGQGNVACHPYSGIQGCDITSRMECAFHTNRLVVTNLPSSSAGLPVGALWYDPADGNRVKFVS